MREREREKGRGVGHFVSRDKKRWFNRERQKKHAVSRVNAVRGRFEREKKDKKRWFER